MVRHIERNDAILVGNGRIVKQMAVLPAVRAGGVKAEQRDAPAGFLKVDAVAGAVRRDIQITALYGFDIRHVRFNLQLLQLS